MKKIEAIIRHTKLEDVKHALYAIEVHGMTVTEVRGFGRRHENQNRSNHHDDHLADFLPKVKIEVVITDELEDLVVDTISESARTGFFGDGKIFVIDLARTVRIRTGEVAQSAL